jgi:hypothetical protein
MKKLLFFLLFAIPTLGQVPATVTGLISDAGNNPATSGYVQFDVQPKASSIQYFILNVTTINPTTQCSINGSGQIQNFTLSGPCLVWGNDNISPGNTTYKVTFAPNGQITNAVNGELITGSAYNLNAPVFATIVQISPQQNIVRANPFQTNIIPVANNIFNIGSPSFQYANGYFSQIFLNGVALSFPGFTLATNNTWTGINNFNNTVNLNNGGSIGGTWIGSPAFSGNPAFSGTPTFSHASGVSPFTVTSTTLVTNLNSQFLSGLAAPASAILGLTDTQSPTNKTFDVSLNTVKWSSNTAGHYLRNNGTSYVDNTLQPADLPATASNCAAGTFATGLSAGGTPVCAVGLSTVATVDLAGQTASVGPTTLLTPGSNSFYRINVFIVRTTAAGTNSTLPAVNVVFTEPDGSNAETIPLTATDTVNVAGHVGGLQAAGFSVGTDVFSFYAKSGVAVQYSTTGYASNPVNAMQYALHIRLEGPF